LTEFAKFPLWLEFTGLPEFISKKAKPVGWVLFKKLIELDCYYNSIPDVFEISVSELSQRTGIESSMIPKLIEKLNKLKYIGYFLPDNEDEKGMFKIIQPIKTPIKPEEIDLKANPQLKIIFQGKLRYYHLDTEQDKVDYKNKKLSRIVDLYMTHFGGKINTFILDELIIINNKFPLRLIEQIFAIAVKNEIFNLRWIVQQLYKEMKKCQKQKVKI
jgi:hypothetical protein